MIWCWHVSYACVLLIFRGKVVKVRGQVRYCKLLLYAEKSKDGEEGE